MYCDRVSEQLYVIVRLKKHEGLCLFAFKFSCTLLVSHLLGDQFSLSLSVTPRWQLKRDDNFIIHFDKTMN